MLPGAGLRWMAIALVAASCTTYFCAPHEGDGMIGEVDAQ